MSMAVLMLLSISGGLASAGAAPGDDADRAAEVARQAAAPAPEGDSAECEGFWPTRKMMDNMIRRWAHEATERYELSPDQSGKLESMMLERWPRFMQDNRRVMQPLINQFFEATLDVDPPSAQAVTDWADRALPLFQTFRESVKESNTLFRETLSAKQKSKFDLDALGLAAGMTMAETQLKTWQRGEFDPKDWGGNRERERARRERERAELARAAAASQPTLASAVLVELDSWDRYVSDFIANYHLDDGQRASADSILTELKARARDMRERSKERLDAIQKELADADGDAKQKLTDELVSLYQPVDDIFAELKHRLDKLPTAAQRAGAKPSADPK